VGRDEEALPTGCRGRTMPGKLLQGGRVGTASTMLWVRTRWAAVKVDPGSHAGEAGTRLNRYAGCDRGSIDRVVGAPLRTISVGAAAGRGPLPATSSGPRYDGVARGSHETRIGVAFDDRFEGRNSRHVARDGADAPEPVPISTPSRNARETFPGESPPEGGLPSSDPDMTNIGARFVSKGPGRSLEDKGVLQ
jgi:hypothetical protein